LPSYASATQRTATPTASAIHGWSFVIFTTAAIFSTIWASKGDEAFNRDPQSSPPLLPYFATLSVILALGFWVGYLVFISYDDTGAPRVLRKAVISISIIGKFILGAAHLGLRSWYWRYYTVQLNWVAAFVAAQAWWDLLLLIMYSCLRVSNRE